MMYENKVHRLALLWVSAIIYFLELALFIYVTVGYFESGYSTLGWLTAGMLIVFAVVTMVTSMLLLVADLMDRGKMETPVWLFVVRIILSLLLLDLVFRLIEYTYKTSRTIHHRDKYSHLIKQVRILLILQTFFGSIPQTTAEITAWIVLDDDLLATARGAKLGVSLVSMIFGMVTLYYLLMTSKENYSVNSGQFTDPEHLIKPNPKERGKIETTSRCWIMIKLSGWYALLLARIGGMALLLSTLLDYRYAVIFVAVYNVTIRVVLMELWNCGKCQQDYRARFINAVMVFFYVDVMVSTFRKLRIVTYYLLSSVEIVVMATVGLARINDPAIGPLVLFIVVLVLVVYGIILLCFHCCCGAPNTVSVQPREDERIQESNTSQTYSLSNGTTIKSNATSKNTNVVASKAKKQTNPKKVNQKASKVKQGRKSASQKNANQNQKSISKGQENASKGQQNVSKGQLDISEGQTHVSQGEHLQNVGRNRNDSSSDSGKERRIGVQSQEYGEDSDSENGTKPIVIKSAETQRANAESPNPHPRPDETSDNSNPDSDASLSAPQQRRDATNTKLHSATSSNKSGAPPSESHRRDRTPPTSPPTTSVSDGRARSNPNRATPSSTTNRATSTAPTNRATSTAGKNTPRKTATSSSPRRYEVPAPRTKPYLSSLSHAQQIYREPQIHKTMPTQKAQYP